MKVPKKIPSHLQAALLSILINGEKYGREIRNTFEERMKRRLSLGSMYTTLSRMEDAGFVESRMGESAHARGGYRRKYFKITGVGERAHREYQMIVARTFGGAIPNV